MNSVVDDLPPEWPVRLGDAPLWVNTPAAVACGFPSPAEDFAVERIDLAAMLASTADSFVMKAGGASMTGASIHPGDLLVVRRNLAPVDMDVVVAVVDHEFTCKHIRLDARRQFVRLEAANPAYPPIEPKDGQEVRVWGVVTHVIKALRCLH